jgi:hypothetical protein
MGFMACQQAQTSIKGVWISFDWNTGVVSQGVLSADRAESQGDLLLNRSTKRGGRGTEPHDLGKGRCKGFCK